LHSLDAGTGDVAMNRELEISGRYEGHGQIDIQFGALGFSGSHTTINGYFG
tara:strand:+ start:921 stop:1073 length:153 start_codon:yes stop_codon:yes gene_type:complete